MKKIIKYLLQQIGYKIIKDDNLEISIPVEASNNEKELINLVKEYSMTDYKNLYLSTQALKYIAEKKIEGDIVECGVWKGGHLIIFKSLCEKYNLDKKIFAYDTFDGMTESSINDFNHNGENAIDLMKKTFASENNGDNIWCYASLDLVKKNITNVLGNTNNINFIKGDVIKTLQDKKNLPKKISILRLDTDFYESTKIELLTLFPLLEEEGILIIDDYGHWNGAKKAVDEFFENNYHFKHVINGSCRMIIKKKL
jgi:O-methyltransferase